MAQVRNWKTSMCRYVNIASFQWICNKYGPMTTAQGYPIQNGFAAFDERVLKGFEQVA